MIRKQTLIIIPAKDKSTRLPHKNILDFHGKPLIAYAIEKALSICDVNDICISTESEQVTKVAMDSGAKVPFIRPKELSVDPATISDVCKHSIEHYMANGIHYENVIVLLPTSPLVTVTDILKGYEMFQTLDGTVMSVTEFPVPPYNARCFVKQSLRLVPCFPDSPYKSTKSTECPKTYHSNGAFVIFSTEKFLESGSIYGNDIYGYIMPQEQSIDIDTKYDFEIAKHLFGL
ncbi:cytidylyltransferase domain-containing protein [Thermodesulfobacteriota bacterium]